jgi:pyridoxal phosphate enzyme (YggS family)
MLPPYEEFARRASAIHAQIAAICQRVSRDPAEVQLLAVTKTHPAAAVEYAARFGLKGVGENRVQEGTEKRAQTTVKVRWELIGHLQSNKARVAARSFDRIQTVDRAKLLDPLDQAAAETGTVLPILLQVNAGNDPAKFGVDVSDAAPLLEAALQRKHLRVDGLMTIAPLGSDAMATTQHAERTFTNLRTLRDQLAAQFGTPLRELSMGMTGDLAIAVAAGSTLVRVGTA